MHFSTFQPEKNITFIYLFYIFQVKKSKCFRFEGAGWFVHRGQQRAEKAPPGSTGAWNRPANPVYPTFIFPWRTEIKAEKIQRNLDTTVLFSAGKKDQLSLLSQSSGLGKHLIPHVQKKNRSFHLLRSHRKEKERRQTLEAVSVSAAASLQLHRAAVVELELAELVVFGASCEGAQAAPGAPRSLHGWPGVSWWMKNSASSSPGEPGCSFLSVSLSLFSREDSKSSSSSTADMSFSPPLFFPSFPQMFFHRHFMHKQVESSAEDFNLKDKHLSVIMGAWEKLHKKKNTSVQFPTRLKKAASLKGKVLVQRKEKKWWVSAWTWPLWAQW